MADPAFDDHRMGAVAGVGSGARRAHARRGYGKEPGLRPRSSEAPAHRRDRARRRQRRCGDGRDRVRRSGRAAPAQTPGGPPAGTPSARERAWRRGPDPSRRHHRSPAADPAGAQARGGDRDHRSAVPVRPDLPVARGGGVMEIEAQGIAIRFGPVALLEGVDLAMRGGEMVGLIGPNGSGKTTLLRVLANLRAPEAGRVHYAGRTAAEIGTRELSRQIAYLAQGGAVHWPMRVETLVALGRLPHRRPFQGHDAADRHAIERAMTAADVAYLRTRTMGQISGGERLRVLLARALAVDARVLLADEPIAALDPLHQLQVMELLRMIASEGRGVIVVLHDLALATRFCDRLILLARGGILLEGAPAHVLTDAHVAEAYGVEVVRGERDGVPFLLPWKPSAKSEGDVP